MRKKTIEQPEVIYYQDELKDEFAGDNIQPKEIDGSYRYDRFRPWEKALHIFWYRIVAFPLAKCYMKLHFHHRIVGKEKLAAAKNRGYYMYGNHTHGLADALIPTMVNSPVDVSVIVHPNNVSMPVLGRITPYLGALPLPGDPEAAKHFMKTLSHRMENRDCVMIYPEAHIWPYYTDIRPFTDTSFRYPLQHGVPVFALTNTYQKWKNSSVPQIVTYIDGPFYPDTSLPKKEQKQVLRDQVYAAMKARSKENNVTLIRYVKKEE